MIADGRFRRRRKSQGGDTMLETSLLLVPLLAMVLGIMDMGMAFFVHNTFQNAVREGSRFATTWQVRAGYGQIGSIRDVVRQFSMGFLTVANMTTYVNVRFYNPITLVEQTGAGSNSPGNIVEVSIESYNWGFMAPIQRNIASFSLTTRSASRLEPLAPGVPPPALNP